MTEHGVHRQHSHISFPDKKKQKKNFVFYIIMGNSFPPVQSNRSTIKSTLKKSSSVREYRRQTSLVNNCLTKSTRQSTSRRYISLSRPRSLVRTDGEIIDIDLHRHEGDERLMQQLEYIYSCVRKDKGLFGMFD